jgi:hypothetical protein
MSTSKHRLEPTCQQSYSPQPAPKIDPFNVHGKNPKYFEQWLAKPYGRPWEASYDQGFRTYDWLDGLRRMMQLAQNGTSKTISLQDPISKRWFSKSPEVLPMWRSIHKVNTIEMKPGNKHEECLAGQSFVQWSHCIPNNEQCIVNMMIWLHEVGAFVDPDTKEIIHDPVELERWKQSILNLVPMIPWMGAKFDYPVGGLLLAPTKKCIWRLCLKAQASLYDYAAKKPAEEFKNSNVTQSKGVWEETIEESGIAKYVKATKQYHQMGLGYLREFGEDYENDELTAEAILDVNILVDDDRGGKKSIQTKTKKKAEIVSGYL